MILKEKKEIKKGLKSMKKVPEAYMFLSLASVDYYDRELFAFAVNLLYAAYEAKKANEVIGRFDPDFDIDDSIIYKTIELILGGKAIFTDKERQQFFMAYSDLSSYTHGIERYEYDIPEEIQYLVLGLSRKLMVFLPNDQKIDLSNDYHEVWDEYMNGDIDTPLFVEQAKSVIAKYNKTKEQINEERGREVTLKAQAKYDQLDRKELIIKELEHKINNGGGDNLSKAELLFLDPDFLNSIQIPEKKIVEIATQTA